MRRKHPAGVYMQLSSPHALKAWLAYKRMSYQDLADLVGCSKQFIHMLATGKKKTCRPETALRIEQVLLPPVEHRSPDSLPLFVPRFSKSDGGTSKTVGAGRNTAA